MVRHRVLARPTKGGVVVATRKRSRVRLKGTEGLKGDVENGSLRSWTSRVWVGIHGLDHLAISSPSPI